MSKNPTQSTLSSRLIFVLLELDHWALELRKFDQEVQQLTDLATIFDITIPEYKM